MSCGQRRSRRGVPGGGRGPCEGCQSRLAPPLECSGTSASLSRILPVGPRPRGTPRVSYSGSFQIPAPAARIHHSTDILRLLFEAGEGRSSFISTERGTMTIHNAPQELRPSQELSPDQDNLSERIAGQAVIEKLLSDRAGIPSPSLLGRFFGADPLTQDNHPWYKGALGEIAVGGVLARLGTEWMVLHAVPVG